MIDMLTVIYNPTSGRGKRASDWRVARERLVSAGACFLQTEGPGHATLLAKQASMDGGTVVAAGGDGTLSEVVNGIFGTEACLGVLPLGTGNDFARCIGVGTDLVVAVDAILGDQKRQIDVLRWTIGDRTGLGVNVAGAGFDAMVATRINAGFRRLTGTTAYVAAVLDTLMKYRPVSIRVTVDGVTTETTAMLCSVANCQTYGGGMRIAPDASLDDGLLDVVIVEGVGKLEFLKTFPKVFAGKHIEHPKVKVLRGREIRIESEHPIPVLNDGEIAGTTPIDFEVLPRSLWVKQSD